MGFKEQYERGKENLLKDKSICKENIEWFSKILEKEEYKLKRMNGLAELDDKNYNTLCKYINYCKNVNRWFKNKPGKDYTKADIKKVYDGLEDNKLTPNGDRKKIYSAFFKSKPFEIIDKKSLAQEIIEYTNKKEEDVRFYVGTKHQKIRENIITFDHKVAYQLFWDLTENMSSILQLRLCDCKRVVNTEDGEPEYHIKLRKETLKRSRIPRTEPTSFPETVELLDELIKRGKVIQTRNKKGRFEGSKYEPYEEEDLLFNFGDKVASDMFKAACVRARVTLDEPAGITPTLKDVRSSSACNLLDMGWTYEEVNGRLGHKPSSKVLDRYITHKAINKRKQKNKVSEFQVKEVEKKLEQEKEKSLLRDKQLKDVKGELSRIKELLKIMDINGFSKKDLDLEKHDKIEIKKYN